MAKSTDYRGIHISIRYEYGYDYYEIREINKGKKWNDVTLFSTLKEAKQYIDDHYDELVELCNVKESKSSARKSIKESAEDINNTAYFDRVAGELHSWYVCYVEDYKRKYEYGFKNEKECINWIKKNGFDLDPSMTESKTSARKSIKESNLPNKIYEGRKVDTFIIYYEERNGETDGYEVNGVKQLKDALKWLHSDEIDVVKITVYKRGKDFDNNHDDVTEYYSWKESKKSTRKSLRESENFVNYIAVYDEDSNCRGYIQNESPRLTQDVEKALHFENENEANTFCAKLIKRGSFNNDELYVEGIYLNESKKSVRKSIKESKDSYKVKVLNEILDAMAKDEYNIPKVGIYGVTKNINLDEGAIQLLIDYYK